MYGSFMGARIFNGEALTADEQELPACKHLISLKLSEQGRRADTPIRFR